MGWPPKAGELLPRAADAWYEQVKLVGWVLAAEGHGAEWRRVFHVGTEHRELVWEAIAAAVEGTQMTDVRELGQHGLNCEVDVVLTIGVRRATVRTVWHYAGSDSAPRLVSAFPKL